MTSQYFLGQLVKIDIENYNLDFATAKDAAKQKMKELSPDSMLLSWFKEQTGEYYPTIECGKRDKPAWIEWAEARGGDITIDINDGKYIFIFLSLH